MGKKNMDNKRRRMMKGNMKGKGEDGKVRNYEEK
jgi:hypothetical protein